VVARISANVEQFHIAESAARTVLSSPFAVPYFAVAATVGLALIAVQRGDASTAQDQYAALEPSKGVMALYIGTDRLLGLLAQTMGQFDRAIAHFEDALVFCRKAGYRPELAWSYCDYAEALLERNASDDRAKAVSLLEESLAISSELGMRPLMERVTTLQQRVEPLPGRAPEYPDRLSQREVEIIHLIALGRTNRGIAGELFISDRTVAQHVTSILNKTNSANRAEAATYAARHGLV